MSRTISRVTEDKLPNRQFDSVIVNTYFDESDFSNISLIQNSKYLEKTSKLVEEAIDNVKPGGLLFVYGTPKYLGSIAVKLNKYSKDHRLLFKYWIAIEGKAKKTMLNCSHVGLLMYLKTPAKRTIPFHLNTKELRVPYSDCTACGNNVKDWGGKKHLMNPLGTALSDIWSDLNVKLDGSIPKKVVDRIVNLVGKGDTKTLIIKQNKIDRDNDRIKSSKTPSKLPTKLRNSVEQTDCIKYLEDLHNKYPNGVFDVAFADPPYNLDKEYSSYDDAKRDEHYIEWCNQWLQGMVNNLKPGGALYVLNIPKWAVYHADFLSKQMEFRHWIVWNALSTPAGKLLPSHYALLYYTKPGKPKINYDVVNDIDSREYCLRASCIKSRKQNGIDRKEPLSDIWHDVHRIKHRKDRDQHPCQLPVNLMKRIILLSSNEGDLIFDPFGGAGTTAISAKLLKRDYVITELDKTYAKIAKQNLSRVVEVEDGLVYDRPKVSKVSNGSSKRKTELRYFALCRDHDEILSIGDVQKSDPELFSMLESYNGSFKKLQNIYKRMIEAERLTK